MSEKLNSSVFRWFLFFCLICMLSDLADYLCRALQWYAGPSLQVDTVCLWAIISFIFCVQFRRSDVHREMIGDELVGKLCELARFSSTLFLLFCIALLCKMSTDNLLLPLSFFSDAAGKYEVAEIIFRFRECRIDKTVPFSAWRSSSNSLESPTLRLARDQAVAKVFGSKSLEMANRLYFCALKNISQQRALFDSDVQLFENARSIYHINHDANGEISCLRELYFIADELHREQEKISYLKAAHLLLPHCTKTQRYVGIDILAWCARSDGLSKISLDMSECHDKLYRSKSPRTDYRFPGAVFLLISLLAISVPAGTFVPILVRSVLPLKYLILKKNWKSTLSADSRHALLSRLIDIDVELGNFDRASKNSERLMQLVGHPYFTDIDICWTQKKYWNRSVFFNHLRVVWIVALLVACLVL